MNGYFRPKADTGEKLKVALPRRSVVKAIIGAIIMFLSVASVPLGYNVGIFGIIPIVWGAVLMRDYFRELGFNS